MDPLPFIKAYREGSTEGQPLTINLVTNFTDAVLEAVLGGMCVEQGYAPTVVKAPYRQYMFALTDAGSEIRQTTSTLTFVYFDATNHKRSEFLHEGHIDDVLAALRTYIGSTTGTVVVSLMPLPYRGSHGHRFKNDPLYRAAEAFNAGVHALAQEFRTLAIHDANKTMHMVGERSARDYRGHDAFDMPYSATFLAELAHEWMAYVFAATGRSKKVVVVDLDNTLWGGVVGEDGADGIVLGAEYPGSAYVNFQHALKSLKDQGVLLAIASKNNLPDVEEVFTTHPDMVLNLSDFAAVRANWDEKSENIQSLAQELNVGLDSMVFIDDSPLEREKIRQALPQVYVPEWTFPPEEYAPTLFSLNVFHTLSQTDEDAKKTQMYQEERMRTEHKERATSPEEYLASLNLTLTIQQGSEIDIPRAAQLTQKTNQFNLTTKRYTEADIETHIEKGVVLLGSVSDVFGSYGKVILAIASVDGTTAVLDTFLMSCRVMGRTVEDEFFYTLLTQLKERGVKTLHASFVPTAKNAPAQGFLERMGGTNVGEHTYEYSVEACLTSRTGKPIITVTI